MSDSTLIRPNADVGTPALLPTANLAYAHNGIGADLSKIDSGTTQLYTPAVIRVMALPEMYQNNPQMQMYLQALWERVATTVNGVDIQYDVQTADTTVGHDNQPLVVPTKTTRATVAPSLEVPETYGSQTWWGQTKWIKDMIDPDTNIGLPGAPVNNFVPTAYSMTVMILQFGATQAPSDLQNAVLITNIFPTSSGPFNIQKQVGATNTYTRNFSHAGLIQHNDNVLSVAAELAAQMNLHKINYQQAAAAARTKVAPSIADSGLYKEALDFLKVA